MKVSLNAIKNLTQIDVSVQKLIPVIAAQIGEVADVIELSDKYKGILIARIEKKDNHPNADKLMVYTVNTGMETVQVVAGDKSLAVGDLVVYFPVGTRVPNNMYPEKFDGVVKKTKLRGVESNGMLASAKELDISDDHESVLRLDALEDGSLPVVGSSFAETYGLVDTVIEIENKALTNRPECFGLIGLAREVAGIQGQKFSTPEWFDFGYEGVKVITGPELDKSIQTLANEGVKIAEGEEGREGLEVRNECPELVRRYVMLRLSNIAVKKSPVWLQVELMKSDVKPINNVVDVTNYLMILTGQPLHAFDYDRLIDRGRVDKKQKVAKKEAVTIIVRTSRKGETVATLDNKTHELDDETVVICDKFGPVAIGGVIGGVGCEITADTKSVLLESANFDMYNLRKTSNKYGLFTDAVTRFSKNQDPNKCGIVLQKAVKMLADLTRAEIAGKVHDIKPQLRKVRHVEVSVSEVNERIGKTFTVSELKKILQNVELKVEVDESSGSGQTNATGKRNGILRITIPTYRQDLILPEDINEEIIRLIGYSQITPKLPTRTIQPVAQDNIVKLKTDVRNILVGLGAYELLTYSFIGQELLEATGQSSDDAYHLQNAISPKLEYMRLSLVPSLLEKIVQNHNDGYEKFALFEVNKTHMKGELGEDGLPQEFQQVGFVYSCADSSVKTQFEGSPYYQAKKYLDELFKALNVADIEYEQIHSKKVSALPVWLQKSKPMYNGNGCAVITYTLHNKKHYLGIVGAIADGTKSTMKLPKYVSAMELDLKALLIVTGLGVGYRAVPKYPAVVQDLCLIADKDVPYSVLVKSLQDGVNDEDLYLEISPVDIYSEGEGSDKDNNGTRQVTLRVQMRHTDKVLSSEEIEIYRKRMLRNVRRVCNAVLKEI